MIDLSNVTFILPIKIETPDRARNFHTVVGYLNHHFKTKIIVVENNSSSYHILPQFTNLDISYTNIASPTFHRTRFINIALSQVDTPVTCVYDVDVLMRPEQYELARDLISTRGHHFVYPYGYGKYQWQIAQDYDQQQLRPDYDLSRIPQHYMRIWDAFCGHCFFADTSVYKDVGGENENFVSYAPEDQERYHRFCVLETDVIRIPTGFVYHLEHERTPDSNSSNPYYKQGMEEFQKIKQINTRQEMKTHYAQEEYLKRYPGFGRLFA